MKLLSCHPKSTFPLHKIPSNPPPPSLSSLPNNPHSLHFSSSTKSTNPNRLSIRCRRSEYFEPQQPKFNTNPTSEAPSSKIYVGYSIYKGKAALQVEPRAPEFAPLDTGAFKLSKEGFVFLQFAPAIATRQYDWSRKQIVGIKKVEVDRGRKRLKLEEGWKGELNHLSYDRWRREESRLVTPVVENEQDQPE